MLVSQLSNTTYFLSGEVMILSNKHIALALILSVPITNCTNNILGMQLRFYLNDKREIKAHGASAGMDYYEKPEVFEGKDILDVLPHSKETREEILKKFMTAKKQNSTVFASYTLENKNYIAKIVPLNSAEGISYFVKVKNQE